ncbi:interferon alpha-14 [Ascaphus truei]|uniref:interferon alpha-14 n=1 Tax=Ascaphus truei TaxID=8439 RepID=UPI003F5A2E9C
MKIRTEQGHNRTSTRSNTHSDNVSRGFMRVFLLLSLSSFSYSQNCKWLQPHQERLNQLILQNFNLMVGAAALAVREVTNQTNWFYIKHHESLRCRQQAWERLQALLHYQGNQLAECIPEGAENHLQKEAASKYFHTLEEIVQEQDNNVCARNIIRMEVGRNLRLAAQLSSRMGRGKEKDNYL